MERKLYRNNTDRMIAGVCGGLGEYLNVDPTLIRLLFVLSVLAGFGSSVLFYIIMMVIVPLKDTNASVSVQ
jgi:phage shock protein C